LVTDVFDLDADDDLREQIEKSARHLYGLVHARYILTTRGLTKMVRTVAPLVKAVLLTLSVHRPKSTRKAISENALV
jgi:hypothetical protein